MTLHKLSQVRKFGNRIPSPVELIGFAKLDFQDPIGNIPNLNNINHQLPESLHKMRVNLIDHELFKL